MQNCGRWRFLTSGSEVFSTSGIKDGNNVISRNTVLGCQALEVPLWDPESQAKTKAGLDGALSNLIQLKMSLLTAGGLD